MYWQNILVKPTCTVKESVTLPDTMSWSDLAVGCSTRRALLTLTKHCDVLLYSNGLQLGLSIAIMGEMPMGSTPAARMSMGRLPLESMLTARMTMGRLPMGSMPMGRMPMGSMPTARMPMGSMPMGRMPMGRATHLWPLALTELTKGSLKSNSRSG
jgi:hypothetical protein